ncbi:hypothetical protein DV753_20775 [Escherichia coli]|nr:hypothetical protein [Escherichia coli]
MEQLLLFSRGSGNIRKRKASTAYYTDSLQNKLEPYMIQKAFSSSHKSCHVIDILFTISFFIIHVR